MPYTVPTKSLESTCNFLLPSITTQCPIKLKKTPKHFQTLYLTEGFIVMNNFFN